jgi:hypothetical protein
MISVGQHGLSTGGLELFWRQSFERCLRADWDKRRRFDLAVWCFDCACPSQPLPRLDGKLKFRHSCYLNSF